MAVSSVIVRSGVNTLTSPLPGGGVTWNFTGSEQGKSGTLARPKASETTPSPSENEPVTGAPGNNSKLGCWQLETRSTSAPATGEPPESLIVASRKTLST